MFVCEGTFLQRDLPEEPVGHLSVKQAAEAAERIRAKGLLLTHLFPEYDRDEIEEEVKGKLFGTVVAGGDRIDLVFVNGSLPTRGIPRQEFPLVLLKS